MTASSDFAGRRVVVTGGAGALGSAVVGRLLAGGAERVVVPLFSEQELEGFDLKDDPRVRTIGEFDLADEAQVSRFYDAATEEGPVWASVHVAGGFAMGPIGEAGGEAIEKMLRMNAQSCYLCCRAAVLAMCSAAGGEPGPCEGRCEGRVVNVAARPAEVAEQGANMVAYAASKAAVSAMTRALAAELVGDGRQIWVNAVAPSIIDTPANREAMPDADYGSWPTPEEIAETVCFLASPANRVTRGAVVPVYGRA